MQDLEEIINMINSMSLDACKMAENIGNGVGAALGEAVSSPNSNGHSDSYAAISEGIRTAAGYTSMVTGAINNLDDITIKSRFYGSFLEYVKEHSQNQTVKDFIPHLRAIVGDFGLVNKGESIDLQFYSDNNFNGLNDLFTAFLEPDGVKSINAVEANNIFTAGDDKIPERINFVPNETVIGSNDALYKVFYDEMISILDKIGPNGSKLTDYDLTMIRMLPKNGYKILNAVYVLGDSASDREEYLIKYAKYVALEYLASSMEMVLSETAKTIADYSKSLTITPEGMDLIDHMITMVGNIQKAGAEIKRIHSEWRKKIPDVDKDLYQKQLEQQIKNSLK
jgi:hypothetical protein